MIRDVLYAVAAGVVLAVLAYGPIWLAAGRQLP